MNDPDETIEFIFGENNKYHQIGTAYLEFDITVRNAAGNFIDASKVRLINNAFAYCFKEEKLATTGGADLEHIKNVGQLSTIMSLFTSKDSDFSSFFDKNGENAHSHNKVLKQTLVNNHATDDNKGKIKEHLPLQYIFGFCQFFNKITENLVFHPTFKTANPQDIIFTTIATDIDVTINSLYLYVPILIPNTHTQFMFFESFMNNYTITFDSWYIESKISNDGRELQVDIVSA